jgi:transaldolase
MKIFLDTANLGQIKEAIDWGVLDGVTTNPTLIQREGRPFEELARAICEIVPGPVNLEVVAEDHRGMVKEGRQLAALHPNVVVKVPMTPEGLKAVRSLRAEGIRTNVTLVFSANQALLAAKAGASYVSPFIGRLDDMGHEGMQVVREIVGIFRNYGFPAEVLVGSIRHPLHVTQAALLGAHIATMPHEVLRKLVGHSLTDAGLRRFLEDWRKVPEGMRPF